MKTALAVVGAVALLLVFGLFALCNDDEGDPDSFGPIQLVSHYEEDQCRWDNVRIWGQNSGIESSRLTAAGNGKAPAPIRAMESSASKGATTWPIESLGSWRTVNTRYPVCSSVTAVTTRRVATPTISSSERQPITAGTPARRGDSTISSPSTSPMLTASGATPWMMHTSMAMAFETAASARPSGSSGTASHDGYEEPDCDWSGDCRGQEYDQWNNEDRNRNRNRNRGAFSPGPFDDSPVDAFNGNTICLPGSTCYSDDRRGQEPPPDEREMR